MALSTEEMMAELREAGVAFDYDEDMPGFWLNVNDTFAYACADAEEVEPGSLPEVYDLWKHFGWEGVILWVWKKRKEDPLSTVKEAIFSKIPLDPFVLMLYKQ